MNRNITGKTTIPEGVAANGTISSATNDNTLLYRQEFTAWVSGGAVSTGLIVVYQGSPYINLTGTNTAVAPSLDNKNWKFHVPETRNYVWIYLPDDGAGNQKIARIKKSSYVLDETGSTYVEYFKMDREIETTGAVAFQFVVGDLQSYFVDNNGGSNGVLNGETFKSNEILNQIEKKTNSGHKFQDVAVVDGSGTNLYVVENK